LSNFLSVCLIYTHVFNFTICIFFIIRLEFACVQFSGENIRIVVPRNIPYFINRFMNSVFPLLKTYKQGFVSLNSTFLFSFSRTAKSPAFTSVNINCCESSAFILIIYIPTYLNGLSEVRSVILFLAEALDKFKTLLFSQRTDNRQR
ncbi:MAG: hypothetical protein MW689_000001, partial [Thermodesulfobacteria bacterium]|nr:hypothetical protein [Thermodesulfobacteriota bacterium]MCU4139096.1 hypothetical protein [Thermodesulfobacteriota bacterium]